MLGARHFYFRAARLEVRRRQHCQLSRRRRQHERWFARHAYRVCVRLAAEAPTSQVESICEGSKGWRGRSLRRSLRDLCGRKYRRVNATGLRGDGRIDHASLERSGKQGAPGWVGDHMVAIGEIYGDSWCQAAARVQDRQRGGFAGKKKHWRGKKECGTRGPRQPGGHAKRKEGGEKRHTKAGEKR